MAAIVNIVLNIFLIRIWGIILILLSMIVVETPPLWGLWLTIGFLFVIVYNFSAITLTLQELLHRKRR